MKVLLSTLIVISTLLQAETRKPSHGGAFTAGFINTEKNTASSSQAVTEETASGGITTLPDSYPENFQRLGVIDNIHFQQRLITANEFTYLAASIMPIYSLDGSRLPFSKLTANTQIGFTFIRDKNIITTIWVLPDNYSNSE